VPLVNVNGVGLLVEETGSGEPLVLVHGSWDDRDVWALVEEELAQSFRVISYARRGHTGSEDDHSPGSRREDEDDLAALIEVLELAPAHIAANSFGTSIALGLAGRRPELVRSVCGHEPPLIALAADDPLIAQVGEGVGKVLSLIDAGKHEEAARVFAEEVALGPGAWEMMPPDERASMTANAATFADEQRDPDWATLDLDALAALDRPVMLTQGDLSPPFFAAIIARLAAVTDRVEVRTLAGAGHVPHVTHPREWVMVVRELASRAS
jgi:pimeloyl-ACP methyl ester carboxylesterase